MPDPVLLIGIPSEPPLAMVAAALGELGMPYVVCNQRSVASIDGSLSLEDGVVGGVLELEGEAVPLDALGGIYTREIDYRLLPELEDAPPDALVHAHRVHELLDDLCMLTPARVVNRAARGASNASKPYQAQLIARRFAIPETLVTTEPEAVVDLIARHGRVIYKSVSGTRSIVRELAEEDLGRLDTLGVCPVQFQQRVEGNDVRVHTLADGTLFATVIESAADDWRYADGEVSMQAWTPGDELAERCLALTADLGLEFAGIDLRVSAEGEVYCFEVNTSPAYSAFEQASGQPIARALAGYLAAA
jgi:RimK-like ATP-grasp domain